MPMTIELQITNPERDALLLALPIARYLVSSQPGNSMMFTIAAATAMNKLENRNYLFSFGEVRTMSAVVTVAKDLCAGKQCFFLSPETPVSELRSSLLPYFLPLSQLESALTGFVQDHLEA